MVVLRDRDDVLVEVEHGVLIALAALGICGHCGEVFYALSELFEIDGVVKHTDAVGVREICGDARLEHLAQLVYKAGVKVDVVVDELYVDRRRGARPDQSDRENEQRRQHLAHVVARHAHLPFERAHAEEERVIALQIEFFVCGLDKGIESGDVLDVLPGDPIEGVDVSADDLLVLRPRQSAAAQNGIARLASLVVDDAQRVCGDVVVSRLGQIVSGAPVAGIEVDELILGSLVDVKQLLYERLQIFFHISSFIQT